jgi:hypothetical protein
MARNSETNLYTYGVSSVSGLFTARHPGKLPESRRSARRWAAIGIVSGLFWFFGFASLLAIAAGTYSWREYRLAGLRPTPAVISVLLGVVGLAVALILVV